MASKVCVVILNFCRAADTVECIQSVLRSDYPLTRILAIDNQSPDGSADVITGRFPEIPLIRNIENLGYAEGNNIGIRSALDHGADYVFVLNNDTVIEPLTISRLVAEADHCPEAAILAPRVCYYDHKEVLNSCGTDMDWFRLRPKTGLCDQRDRGQWRGLRERVVFPGCALFMRRGFLEKEGLFDSGFFLLHEDADICYRSIRRGYKNILVPEAVIYHKVSKTLSGYPVMTSYFDTRNFLYLTQRHANLFQKAQSAAGLVLFILLNFARLIAGPSARRKKSRGFFWGLLDYLRRRTGFFPGNFS